MLPLYKLFEFDADDMKGAAGKLFKKASSAISNASGDQSFFKPKADTKWYQPFGASPQEKSRIKGLTRGREEGYNKGHSSGVIQGHKAGETSGYKKGSIATMNRVNTDDKLRGQITRDHITKKASEGASRVIKFGTDNAKTIGLVGAGAVGATALAKRRRQ